MIPKLLPCREPRRGLRFEIRPVVLSADEAIVWLEKARSAVPAASLVHGWLASAYASKGETERAAAELAEARRLAGDDRYTSIASVKASSTWGTSKTRVLVETTYFAGLRKAGLPEA